MKFAAPRTGKPPARDARRAVRAVLHAGQDETIARIIPIIPPIIAFAFKVCLLDSCIIMFLIRFCCFVLFSDGMIWVCDLCVVELLVPQ